MLDQNRLQLRRVFKLVLARWRSRQPIRERLQSISLKTFLSKAETEKDSTGLQRYRLTDKIS